MILHGALADKAWGYYADQVRRDPSNLYCCARLLEHSHRLADVEDGEALRRTAALTVFRADPFAIVTTISAFGVSDLTEDELVEISDGLDRAGGDADATNYLRGKLWSDASLGRENPEPFARRAHGYLIQVSPDAVVREPDYWQALAESCRIIDYTAFTEVLPKLLANSEPVWHASHLMRGLEAAVEHEDWETYSRWRELWNGLPQNAHLCPCYLNHVFTYDGLLELHRDNRSPIPDLLRRSLDVRGCPHLNSYGPDLAVVEALIKRGVLLDEAEAYIEASSKLCADDDRLPRLRKRLEEARSNA